MWLTFYITGKIPGVLQNISVIVWKKVNFILAFVQRKHLGVPFDASKGIPHKGGWCVEDTVESYQKYQMAF